MWRLFLNKTRFKLPNNSTLFFLFSGIGFFGFWSWYRKPPPSGYIMGSPLEYPSGKILKGEPYATRWVFRHAEFDYITPILIKVNALGKITILEDSYLPEKMEVDSYFIVTAAIISQLVKEGADLNVNLAPMICWASSEGKVDILKYLDSKIKLELWEEVILHCGEVNVIKWYESRN